MSNPESFIEEVNDELRRDRLFAALRKYGWIGIAAVILIVGGAAFYEYRGAQDRAAAEALGDDLIAALEADGPEARAQALAGVEPGSEEGRAVQAFLLAAEEAGGGNIEAAVQRLQSVENSADLSLVYRQLASFKALLLSKDQRTIEERRSGFEALAQPGIAFRALAEEQLALLDIEEGNADAALSRLQTLIRDAEATPDLQQRALQVIVALGGSPVPDAAGNTANE
ncbi:MAG: hypothetical protein AAFY74_11840 [Pseudomonadota bacterium]